MKSLLLTGTAAAIAAGLFMASLCEMRVVHAADQTTKVVTLSADKTSPISGKQMYGSYCAGCHGVTGKGDGPLASKLAQHPTDLTILSRNNGGKFPASHVSAVIQFGANIPAHGTVDMPVWGPLLAKMDKANPPQRALRISNLSGYVKTMQAK